MLIIPRFPLSQSVRTSLFCTHQFRTLLSSSSPFNGHPLPHTSSASFLNSPSLPPKPILNIKDFIHNAELHAENIKQRHLPDLNLPSLVEKAKIYQVKHVELQALQHQLNLISKSIGTQLDSRTSNVSEVNSLTSLQLEAKNLKSLIKTLESQVKALESTLFSELVYVPNFTSPDTPIGIEPRILYQSGPALDSFKYTRDHVELGHHLDLFDFIAGTKVSGPSFYFLKRAATLLELGLIQFSMNLATHHYGFMPVSVPDVVRCQVNQACGFQPRDSSSSQSYMLQEPVDGVLAATAEIPLVGMYANTSIPISALPLRMVAMGHAFRKESGARGNDTKGLFRVHQFSKVELVVVSTQDQSNHLFNTLIQLQKNVLEQLGLTFRVLEMPTSELGAPAYRKIDMEAWIPGRQVWGEVSSASHCTDFQARRLNLRLDNNQSPEPFLHTLNGTCAAIPRLIIAILEQFQQQDGTVKVPEVLQPYLNTDVIRPPN